MGRTTSDRARRGRRRDVALGAGLLAVLAYAVWSLTAVHSDGPMVWERIGHQTVCVPQPLTSAGDLTQGLPDSYPGGDTFLGVRLHGAHGVELVEADVARVDGWMGGAASYRPAATAGWPSAPSGEPDAGALQPIAGVPIGGDQAVVLHLHVDDPAQEASFQDVGIVYRSGPFRYEARMDLGIRYAPGACA